MFEDAQAVPKIAPRLANPHSRSGIRLLHGALNVASRPAVRSIAGKLFGGRSKDVDVSRYDAPGSEAPPGAASGSLPDRLLPLLAVVAGLGVATFLATRIRGDAGVEGQ
ncbi:hypothetical protein F4693_001646 [Sphingomonas endophytica]|uniref:Uncharacterized protein n=1 Tax=Sphingomonas endophytica TaxID=869719 RepID=A0A7X0JBT5_9SPHN|nr:hypothetical protein [Sphingomonas endophytica]MBB6504673.1 hypothetical protein [Sphingomonas endophytica]